MTSLSVGSLNPLLPFTSQPTGGENFHTSSGTPSNVNPDLCRWGSAVSLSSLPIGFITCPESLTEGQSRSYRRWEKDSKSYKKDCLRISDFDSNGVYKYGPAETGFRIRLYPSGELTGASYCRNMQAKPPQNRQGESVTSDGLTSASKMKIRRALENSPFRMRVFCTLTFDPAKSVLDSAGVVCQEYAKTELKRFLNTCSVKQKRRYERDSADGSFVETLQYVWVAERQKNGNIHFHIVWNVRFPVQWLTKIWKQAQNSVDVVRLSSVNHASCYIRKYITKTGFETIQGRRYNITQGLHEAMRPEITTYEGPKMRNDVKEIIDSLKAEIESNGGHVIDFGFSIPSPRESVDYEEKKTGLKKKTRRVSSKIHKKVLGTIEHHNRATIAPF
jgi:hypothetical protein